MRDDRPLEMTTRPHLSVSVTEPSQVGEARRVAVDAANEAGFDETTRGRVALVATELANNLVQHARQGRLLVALQPHDGAPCVEIVSLDDGPGMADVDRCLEDGYSTAGTPGTGLGAAQRLSDEFSIFSVAGRGTVVVARLRARAAAPVPVPRTSAFLAGGIAIPAPGEIVSGDAWSMTEDGSRATIMLCDALGHGPDAALVATRAVHAFEWQGPAAPAQRIENMHEELRGTRGAAVAIAALDVAGGTIDFAGAGNVAGRILSGTGDRALMSQHGTVGAQIRKMQDVHYTWPDHALLVLHSDGVNTRWKLDDVPGLLRQEPAVIAAWILREHMRGRDDATVVVVRRR